MAIIKTTLAKDDDNGNTVYIYPKSTADIIEYDENTSVKDKLDELGAEDITIDKLPEGIKKSNTAAVSIGAVNAMLKVAESYFNQCYTPSGEEPGITYQSHTGLYSSNTKTGDGVKAINCSQFVNALLTGVSYENSRYVNDKNTAYNWGIRFDDSNPELFGSTAEDDNVEIANRYLTSQNLAKYAYEHGYLHMIKDNDGCDFKIRPGDIIFSGDDSSSDRYLGIGHVEFVLNVGNEISSYNKSSNTSEKPVYSRIESYAGVSKVDLDGTSHDTAGLRLYGENNITSAKRNICVARFPIGDVAYIPEMIDTVSNIAASAITDPVIYTFSTVAEQGFYTIVFHGKAGVNPYISSVYTNGSGSTYHRPMLHVDDNTYYATIYNQYPGKIQVKMAVSTSGTLNAESKRYYDVEEVTLYKGYADPSMRVIPHAYGIDDLSDALKTSNITISSGTVNAMLDVAEGYFNYSYLDYQTSDSDEIYHGFAYDNNKGLYKSETKYDDTYNNRYAISNAQFVDAVLNGIAFRNSRYKNDNNAAYTWGIKFDNTAVLGTTNSTDGAEISNRYVTAQNLARYAHDHGYLYKIDENANIRPGDVVFFGTSSDNYLGINRVSIVVNVSTTHLSVIECVAESMKTNADGSQSPVALRINKRSISYFTYGAAFPLGNIDNNIDLIESVFNLQVDTENNDEYTSMHSFSKLLDRGFYTVIMHGVYPTKPYVVLHYNNYEEAVSQGSMHKFGNNYYLTFYVQEPGTVSIVVANNGETYTADDASLYRGYADVSTKASEIYSLYERTEDWRSPSIYGPVKLIPGDDLNELKEGVWYCQNGTDAEQILNIPHITGIQIGSGFRLESKRMTENERYIQTLWYVGYPNNFFVRMYYKINQSEVWSDWYMFSGTKVSNANIEPTPEDEPTPSPPTISSVTAMDSNIAVTWSAATNAQYYTLYRTIAGSSNWVTIASNLTATSYSDSNVTAGTSYQYAVTAHRKNNSGTEVSSSRSAASASVTAKETTPSTPTNVTASAGNGANAITWSAATNAQYYTLERKTSSGSWVTIASNLTATSYSDSNVTAGTSYQYAVTAHRKNNSGTEVSSSRSAASASVTAKDSSTSGGTQDDSELTPAQQVVKNITVGWTLGSALDCTYEYVKTTDIDTDNEGLAYEKGWTNVVTTEYTFKAIKEMGFNAVRIPITWNHHLRDDGNGNVTISKYFLDRVKKVVRWAINEGLYVVINSHHDTATFSKNLSSNYAENTTGLTWETTVPYQLFNADETPSSATQCEYMRKLWTLIATAFKDYDYHLMFEGFNEIQGNPRNGSAPTSTQIANTNALNNAFISAVRAVSGNETRILLCQTYNALNSGDAITGFNVTDDDYIVLMARLFTDDTSEISNIVSTLKSKGYPVILGATGWNTAPSGDEEANFAKNFAKAVKDAGSILFWWDDYGDNYRLLDRAKTNAQTNGSLWSRLETAKALVEGSGGVVGTGLCTVSYDPGTAGGAPITSPETATAVVENIKVGWNLGNTLDCSYDPVRLRDDSGAAVLGTEYEGIGYETGWGDAPATTQAMFEALVNAGFNAIRIPITWNHHLRDAALPDDWGQDKTYTSEIEEYPNLSGNIIISPYFLNRVKTVVNYALNAGFRYVIINSHHDTSDYNVSRPFGYAKKVTGLPWITEIPYQLFHASNQLGSNLSNYDPNMTAEDDFNNMCGYMRQLWTLIATAFKDYDYRVIFEGFNEILKYTRSWEEPTELQVARVNGLNNAFISAVRNAGGNYNKYRVLSCETYAAYASNNALNNFSVTDSSGGDRIILQAHIYNNAPTEFANAAQRINEKVGIPAIFGEVGWNVNSSAPSDLYSFGYNLVQQAKSKGVKVFWWDNNRQGSGTNYYGLLNRWNTDSSKTEWYKPELLRGLIDGSN